jgi:hypothetical protein
VDRRFAFLLVRISAGLHQLLVTQPVVVRRFLAHAWCWTAASSPRHINLHGSPCFCPATLGTFHQPHSFVPLRYCYGLLPSARSLSGLFLPAADSCLSRQHPHHRSCGDSHSHIFFRLLSRPPDWISENELQNLQQAAEKFSTAISDTAALVDRVKQLQEELAAVVSEQTNRTLFLLTTVTVLALPINLIAGLFGMNVGGIPLDQHRYGFFLVLSPLLVLTAFLAFWALGRRRY